MNGELIGINLDKIVSRHAISTVAAIFRRILFKTGFERLQISPTLKFPYGTLSFIGVGIQPFDSRVFGEVGRSVIAIDGSVGLAGKERVFKRVNRLGSRVLKLIVTSYKETAPNRSDRESVAFEHDEFLWPSGLLTLTCEQSREELKPGFIAAQVLTELAQQLKCRGCCHARAGLSSTDFKSDGPSANMAR